MNVDDLMLILLLIHIIIIDTNCSLIRLVAILLMDLGSLHSPEMLTIEPVTLTDTSWTQLKSESRFQSDWTSSVNSITPNHGIRDQQ